MADTLTISSAPATPLARPAAPGLLRVGGPGTVLPKAPEANPTAGTLEAHAKLRNAPLWLKAAVKAHARLQDNSELTLEEFDKLAMEASSIKISGR